MMNVADKEGYHRSMVSSFTEYTHSRNFFQTLQSISCQFMLMGGYLLQTDTIHIIECFRQSGSSDIVRCTGFKLERKFIESRFFKRDMPSLLLPGKAEGGPAILPFHKVRRHLSDHIFYERRTRENRHPNPVRPLSCEG